MTQWLDATWRKIFWLDVIRYYRYFIYLVVLGSTLIFPVNIHAQKDNSSDSIPSIIHSGVTKATLGNKATSQSEKPEAKPPGGLEKDGGSSEALKTRYEFTHLAQNVDYSEDIEKSLSVLLAEFSISLREEAPNSKLSIDTENPDGKFRATLVIYTGRTKYLTLELGLAKHPKFKSVCELSIAFTLHDEQINLPDAEEFFDKLSFELLDIVYFANMDQSENIDVFDKIGEFHTDESYAVRWMEYYNFPIKNATRAEIKSVFGHNYVRRITVGENCLQFIYYFQSKSSDKIYKAIADICFDDMGLGTGWEYHKPARFREAFNRASKL